MTFEQAAVRLAGGFNQAIDTETLRATIQAVLPTTNLGELESIKALPGMPGLRGDGYAAQGLERRAGSPRRCARVAPAGSDRSFWRRP